jgi:hypothetical protein
MACFDYYNVWHAVGMESACLVTQNKYKKKKKSGSKLTMTHYGTNGHKIFAAFHMMKHFHHSALL